jgi:hypothetical protein
MENPPKLPSDSIYLTWKDTNPLPPNYEWSKDGLVNEKPYYRLFFNTRLKMTYLFDMINDVTYEIPDNDKSKGYMIAFKLLKLYKKSVNNKELSPSVKNDDEIKSYVKIPDNNFEEFTMDEQVLVKDAGDRNLDLLAHIMSINGDWATVDFGNDDIRGVMLNRLRHINKKSANKDKKNEDVFFNEDDSDLLKIGDNVLHKSTNKKGKIEKINLNLGMVTVDFGKDGIQIVKIYTLEKVPNTTSSDEKTNN